MESLLKQQNDVLKSLQRTNPSILMEATYAPKSAVIYSKSEIKPPKMHGKYDKLAPYVIDFDETGKSSITIPLGMSPDIRGRAMCDAKNFAVKHETRMRLLKKLEARKGI